MAAAGESVGAGRVNIERMLAQIEVGLVVHDPTGRVAWANDAAGRLLGFEAASMVGRHPGDEGWQGVDANGNPLPGEDHPAMRALQTGERVRRSLISVQGGDGRVWLQVEAYPVIGPDNAVEAVVVTFESRPSTAAEINTLRAEKLALETEVSAAMRALELTESNYRATVRAMSEGVAVHAMDGSIIDANPAAQKILGQTLAQMRGVHPVDPAWALTYPDGSVLPPDEIPSEITRRTGQPCRNILLTVTRAGGDRATLSVNTSPIMIGGAMQGVVATFKDVSSERALLTEVASSRDRLSRLTENLPAVLFESHLEATHDREVSATLRFLSGQTESILGVSAEDLVSGRQHLIDLIDARDRDRYLAERTRVYRELTPQDNEFLTVPILGKPRTLRFLTSTPTRGARGVTVYGFIQDITEQKAINAAIRDAQRRQSVGTLAAGIAHNFNNLLATILPNLELAHEHLSPDLANDMKGAIRAATNASDLVKQLLLLGRPGTTGDAEAVDLCHLVRQVTSICERTFDRRIDIRLWLPDHPVMVKGHESELEQVVLNLCINARDAVQGIENACIEIRLGIVQGVRVELTVRDNGIGMSEETQTRLGDPFFTTKPPGVGNGLGVATAIGIVEESGGTLGWRSAPGEGSTFFIELPVIEIEPKTAAPEAAIDPLTRRARVLVIDDEEMIRTTLGRVLVRIGLEVILEDNGIAGLAVLAEDPAIDVVLLDLSMPGMSGQQVLSEIRKTRPNLPVVVMSGYIQSEDMFDSGTVLLAKPAGLAEIEDAIRRALKLAHAS